MIWPKNFIEELENSHLLSFNLSPEFCIFSTTSTDVHCVPAGFFQKQGCHSCDKPLLLGQLAHLSPAFGNTLEQT